ncbi:uncharacterized protein LACBIDRAFT_332904 [Laccaria bicolor S238N-H82]|uniref:Predicted protein n=1 Tax=Laccaria bicolor (strain S238N-H82 / ATCC MYA-4686) TaxID=486041 RepID=B0DU80_LACBS|nr:uncharacterized protein LACBIDRAFT_332904 [Laccaria bicolor S238N-H82]EDR01902.1 predicted protein [Laccaria bicolor S238N-H82]|eukprot:XP_001887512.1 predicted protein [Laccaria bicolor S238N-H82]
MDDLITDSVQIMIGLTSDAITVVERTPGTAIPPGVNRAGDVTWELRQLLKRPHLSAFASIFDSLIQQGRNISTFRVTMQYDFSESRMVQDYRSKSVLQGFSQVGGLWTFLTGIKPISFLGLAHSTQRGKIRKACHEEYPKIREQIRQPASERGLLSFICDQLIDVGFLDDEVDEANDADSFVNQELDQVEMSQFIPSTFKSEPSFNDAGSALHLSSTAHKWLTFLHISLTFETLLGSSMPTISAKSRKRARSWFKKGQTLQVPADCAARAAGPDSVKEVDIVCTVRTRVILARSTGIGWLSETKAFEDEDSLRIRYGRIVVENEEVDRSVDD